MDSKSGEHRKSCELADIFNQMPGLESLNAAQLGAAYKAAYIDFTKGSISRASFTAISTHLKNAMSARNSEISEQKRLSSQKVERFF